MNKKYSSRRRLPCRSSSYSGSALIIAILAIAAMTTVALGVAQLVPRDFRAAQAVESSLSAEGAAWSGVEHALLLIRSASKQHGFVEIAKPYIDAHFALSERPFGGYRLPPNKDNNCLDHRPLCQGFDLQLANPFRQTPVTLQHVLDTSDQTYYKLLVWHRRHNVGTPQDLMASQSISPTLQPNEVRRLDMSPDAKGQNQVMTFTWDLVPRSSGETCTLSSDTQATLVWSWLKADGSLFESDGSVLAHSRQVSTLDRHPAMFTVNRQADLEGQGGDENLLLSLRLLVSSQSNEAAVAGCVARYAITNHGPQLIEGGDLRGIETADLGFDVIESTGVSNGVQRKIRVIVNRESGKPLNILDFGLICGLNRQSTAEEGCLNLDSYR